VIPPGGGELDLLRAILPRVPDAPEPPPGSGTPKPTAPASPPLRVSDADREATAERLRQACAEGRIDAEELDERLGQTYRARTAPDLVEVLHDLPGVPSAPSVDPEPTRSHPRRRLRAATASYVGLNAWMVGIWAATDIHGYFWPVWTLLPGGIGLITAWIRGGDPPHHLARRAERDERRREARRGRDRLPR